MHKVHVKLLSAFKHENTAEKHTTGLRSLDHVIQNWKTQCNMGHWVMYKRTCCSPFCSYTLYILIRAEWHSERSVSHFIVIKLEAKAHSLVLRLRTSKKKCDSTHTSTKHSQLHRTNNSCCSMDNSMRLFTHRLFDEEEDLCRFP